MTKWLATLAVAGVACSAVAVPTMRLSDGTSTITIQDGSVLDGTSSGAGVISFDGAVGNNWLIGLTGSLGVSGAGGGAYCAPSLDLSSLSYSGGPSTLTVAFSDVGFLTSPQGFDMAVGGALKLAGTITYNLYADSANALFGTGVRLGSFSPNTGQILGDFTGVYDGTIPYSVTMEIVISTSGTGGPGSVAPPKTVPDSGATAVLLGVAMTGLALLRWRFTR